MPTVTYKCPNCNAGLKFDPATNQFACEYCKAQYTEDALKSPSNLSRPENAAAGKEPEFSSQSVYTCPNCGAEVIADTTTAATFCVYCHNPVILSGKVSGDYKPDLIIPFSIEKAQLQTRFADWCKKKKFIHDDFIRQAKSGMIKGVYFPFWVVDCKATAGMSARGENVRCWHVGDTEYTETSIYTIIREGEINFNDITLKALDQKQVNILEGIHPFTMSGALPFSMAYLSGFLAEKRDIEKETAQANVNQVVDDCSRAMLTNTISGYSSLSVIGSKSAIVSENWLYVLLPAWMFVYKFNGEDYFFSMNGQTGKIAGRVPVSRKKLLILFSILLAGITGIGLLLGGLL